MVVELTFDFEVQSKERQGYGNCSGPRILEIDPVILKSECERTLVRLRYAWYYRIKSPSGRSSALAALGTPESSF